ncbi:type I-E CRISPR-associated protein Cse2/CasB [Brachybacterium hainanense]|uniref:Type I-E CRISPR-associated protein Cse2/CasB n=1 Tax=Brachybacterium hainanense TaxID=1541174 RepID=A0ABV6R906_9MICO
MTSQTESTEASRDDQLIARVRAASDDRRTLLALRKSATDPLGAHPDAIALLGDLAPHPGTMHGRIRYLVVALMADHIYAAGHTSAQDIRSIGASVARIAHPALAERHITTLTRTPRTALLAEIPRVTSALARDRIAVPWRQLLYDLDTPDHRFEQTQRTWAYHYTSHQAIGQTKKTEKKG